MAATRKASEAQRNQRGRSTRLNRSATTTTAMIATSQTSGCSVTNSSTVWALLWFRGYGATGDRSGVAAAANSV
jgi:hypothetical protein